MEVALGIDLGQSSVKVTAISLDDDLADVTARVAYPTLTPQPGWVEQESSSWLDAAARACRLMLEKLSDGGGPGQVRGVCVTGATHHAVLIGDTEEVLRPVITMRDVRTESEVRWLRQSHGERILDRTRNVADTAWSLPHLLWIRAHEPQIWARVRTVLFGKDLLVRALTGTAITDTVEAEGSLLWDVANRRWDLDLLGLANLDATQLPEAVVPGTLIGHITTAGSQWSGLLAGIPVFAGSSDTAAEAYAAGANKPGAIVVKLATSGNFNVITDRPRPGQGWITYSHVSPGLAYHAMAVSSAAGALEWLRHLFDPSDAIDFDALDAEAALVASGSDGAIFLPYLGGMRAPESDPRRRAAFVGLDSGHGRGHLVRALYEGVAFALRDCAEVLVARGFALDHARIIGGGAQSALWRQVIADVLDIELTLPRFTESSAGAALMARQQILERDFLDVEGLDAGSTVTVPGIAREASAVAYGRYRTASDDLRGFDHGTTR